MQPADDSTLLRLYTESRSDEAFTELVTRHINFVYSVAMRQVGDLHQAEEITQAVFIILAKKAAALRHEKALASWLFQTTRLTVNNFVRGEMRRHRREQEAFMQSSQNESPDTVWRQIGPELDAAVALLGAQDQRAILLRYYEGRSLREIGAVLGASEDAAEKRVARALEKLRQFFRKHGVDSTTAALAGAISANSVQTAPAGLTKIISAVAVAKGAAASTSTLTLAKGALKVMAWSKTKTTIVGAAIALLCVGGTTMVVNALLPVPDIQGTWEGTVNVPNAGVHTGEAAKDPFVMRIARVNDVYQVKVDDIGQGEEDISLDTFTYKYPSMAGKFSGGLDSGISLAGKVNRSGENISLKFLQNKTVVATAVVSRTSNPTPVPAPLTEAEFAPSAGSDLQGFWVGKIGRGKYTLHIQVKIAEASDGTYRVDFYSVDQGTNRQPGTVNYDGTTVKLMLSDGLGMFEGHLSNGNSEMTGNWHQAGYSLTTTLTQANYSDYEVREAK